MPRVAVLPSAVADQIAAGEVVERPASVVKELLENALDAGAAHVEVAVDDGGRLAIRVSDDGTGMDRDDAVLALQRHATSKIREAGDLVGVASYGFRGEALPAICSVADLELETAPADGAGTRVRASAASIVEVVETARRRGTTVTVARLFFNAPARRKFLRGTRSEWRAIAEVVTAAALARPHVRVGLSHDSKVTLALSPAESLRERVAALWGADYATRFVDVDDVSGATRVSGLVERPGEVGTAARRVFVAVNGRVVRDHGVVRAAEAAYRSAIPSGARPALLLHLALPGDAVDVNVHPAKAEVRFRDRWAVERAVEHAVRRALGTWASASSIGSGARPTSNASAAHALWGSEEVATLRALEGADEAAAASGGGAGEGRPPDGADARAEDTVVPALLQLRRTFLLFEAADGVVLIDQHSAHERVLYERFLHEMEQGGAAGQRLLFPLTLHLTPIEADAFDVHGDLFARLGFEIETFGGHTILVHSVPTPHPRFDPGPCIRETLAALTGDRVASSAPRHERIAATVACKAAIKAGETLSPSEMRALFLSLARTTLPAHDVHGRSTIVRLGWDELERRFGRR